MNGKDYAILEKIDSDSYTIERKGEAILAMLNMETRNSARKDTLVNVIRWLFYQVFEVNECTDDARSVGGS